MPYFLFCTKHNISLRTAAGCIVTAAVEDTTDRGANAGTDVDKHVVVVMEVCAATEVYEEAGIDVVIAAEVTEGTVADVDVGTAATEVDVNAATAINVGAAVVIVLDTAAEVDLYTAAGFDVYISQCGHRCRC